MKKTGIQCPRCGTELKFIDTKMDTVFCSGCKYQGETKK